MLDIVLSFRSASKLYFRSFFWAFKGTRRASRDHRSFEKNVASRDVFVSKCLCKKSGQSMPNHFPTFHVYYKLSIFGLGVLGPAPASLLPQDLPFCVGEGDPPPQKPPKYVGIWPPHPILLGDSCGCRYYLERNLCCCVVNFNKENVCLAICCQTRKVGGWRVFTERRWFVEMVLRIKKLDLGEHVVRNAIWLLEIFALMNVVGTFCRGNVAGTCCRET